MKKILFWVILIFLVFILIFLFSYDKYKDIDFEDFNEYIEKNEISISNESVIYNYFEFLGYDRISNIDISIVEQDNVNIVSVIPQSTLWDSVVSTKYIFYIDTSDEKWQVKDLKKTWKCRKWRWHTYWSAWSCY